MAISTHADQGLIFKSFAYLLSISFILHVTQEKNQPFYSVLTLILQSNSFLILDLKLFSNLLKLSFV